MLVRRRMPLRKTHFMLRCGTIPVLVITLWLASRVGGAVTHDCVDLVADCGAAGDGKTDDTLAFIRCQEMVSKRARARCISAPPRTFACIAVPLVTSNVVWRFSDGTVFKPRNGMSRSESVFYLGAQNATDTSQVRNVTISAAWPGEFVIDISRPQFKPWNVRAIQTVGDVTNFTLANIRLKMADPQTDSRTDIPGSKSGLEFNNVGTLVPSGGRVLNVTSTGGIWGYGTVQVQALKNSHFENLDGTGGVTLRLETGVGSAGAFVGGITARNIVGRNCSAAFMSEPHCQKNGRFVVENVTTFSCLVGALLNGGYLDPKRHPGQSAGWFSNDSAVHGVRSVFGTHSQPDATDYPWPSCSPCGSENTALNYEVAVTGIQAVGFPPPANRTACVLWPRWTPAHCYYNGSS